MNTLVALLGNRKSRLTRVYSTPGNTFGGCLQIVGIGMLAMMFTGSATAHGERGGQSPSTRPQERMAGAVPGFTRSALEVKAPSPHRAFVYVDPRINIKDGGRYSCARQRPCSLTLAQRRVRQILRADANGQLNVVVLLAGGTYRLSRPLKFGPEDSGRNGEAVIWKAASGAHPVISGGKRVTHWTETDISHDIWSAKVPAGTRTLQVYLDGKAAQLAQGSPHSLGLDLRKWNAAGFVTSGRTATYFSHLAARIGPENVKQMEMVWNPMPPTDWQESECPVASIEPGKIIMAQPCWKNLIDRPPTIWGAGNKNNVNPYELRAGSAPTSIVNALPLLTRPGQWYLDDANNTLYYKPTPGQNMARVDVEIPQLQSILQVSGTLVHPVHDLTFRGLTFSTSTWTQPLSNQGFVQVQANLDITGSNSQGECTFTTPAGSCPWAGFGQPPAAVQLTAAHRVYLEDDSFIDLGAVGVGIQYGSDDNLIQGSTFTQIASSAIWLGCAGDPDPTDSAADPVSSIISLCATDPASAVEDRKMAGSRAEIMTGNTVDNNVVYHVGYGYLGAAGVTMMFTQHTTISHNDIFDVPYDGLTSGAWQGHPDNKSIGPTHSTDVTRNINSDNVISGNYFHNDMQVFTGDGGDIYTEGHQGMTIRHSDGAINSVVSFAHGLQLKGNFLNAPPPHSSGYSIVPDVGSQWMEAIGNVAWGFAVHSFSCLLPDLAEADRKYEGNWRSDPDDSKCPPTFHNTQISASPGPADVPLSVLAHAGVQGRYQQLEAALQAKVDYVGMSAASENTPEKVLITGCGFTRSTVVYVRGVLSPHVRFVSSGVLVAVVPAGLKQLSNITRGDIDVEKRDGIGEHRPE